MNTKIGRFFTFLMEEKTRNFFAFALYVSIIVILMGIDLPLALEIIVFIFIIPLGCTIYLSDRMDKIFENDRWKIGKNIIEKIRKIAKEILMFIPINIISNCIASFIIVEQPANQASIEESFYEAPISNSICIILIGPIIEEFIFRSLPYRFIKNKNLYIIVSAVLFAAMHVLNDTHPFYYIWCYMITSLYYGYRYHKTKDLLVPISIHMLNNLIATLVFVFA